MVVAVGVTSKPQKITARWFCYSLAIRNFPALCDSLERKMERSRRKMQLPMVYAVTDVGSNLFSIVRKEKLVKLSIDFFFYIFNSLEKL